MITVSVNGRPVEVPDAATLADLVAVLGLEQRVTAAEHNGDPVARPEHATTRLADGDRIELVRVMAGG